MDNNEILKTILTHKGYLENYRTLIGSALDKAKRSLWYVGFIAFWSLLGVASYSLVAFTFIGFTACIVGFALNKTIDYFLVIIYKIDKELEELNEIRKVYRRG